MGVGGIEGTERWKDSNDRPPLIVDPQSGLTVSGFTLARVGVSHTGVSVEGLSEQPLDFRLGHAPPYQGLTGQRLRRYAGE